jgi:formiminoglutamase
LPLAQINAINFNAASGYGAAEGRHSNNAFRYADDDGYLEKYCMIGTCESSLQQNVWLDIVNNPFIDCLTHEDIFIREKRSLRHAVVHAIDFTDDSHCGINLNTAAGNSDILRQYITFTAMHAQVAYLHIAESLLPAHTTHAGRLTALLVNDFVKESVS